MLSRIFQPVIASNTVSLFIIACLILFLSGCMEKNLNTQTYSYFCGEKHQAVFSFSGDANAATLEMDGKTWILAREKTASGARYSDGAVSFWMKGQTANLTLSQKSSPLNCNTKQNILPISETNTLTNNTPPSGFYAGNYEVIGRHPNKNQQTYRGWARLKEESGELVLDRCINGEHSKGQILRKMVTGDNIPALEIKFTLSSEKFEATCMDKIDFNNYPRLTCYTYPALNPTVDVPGLETYFPIDWPIPDDYFECK